MVSDVVSDARVVVYEDIPNWLRVSFVIFLAFFIVSLMISLYTTSILVNMFATKFAIAYFVLPYFEVSLIVVDATWSLIINGLFIVLILISLILSLMRDDVIKYFLSKKPIKSAITLSEAFLSCFSLSIVLIFIFPMRFMLETEMGEEYFLKLAYEAAVVAPIMEELTFRLLFLLFPLAAIYSIIKKDLSNFKIILVGKPNVDVLDIPLIIITAILFGYTHYTAGWPFEKIYQATVLGLFLGYIAVKRGILSSICLHWAINSFVIFALVILLQLSPIFAAFILLFFSLFIFATIPIGLYATAVIFIRILKAMGVSVKEIKEERPLIVIE